MLVTLLAVRGSYGLDFFFFPNGFELCSKNKTKNKPKTFINSKNLLILRVLDQVHVWVNKPRNMKLREEGAGNPFPGVNLSDSWNAVCVVCGLRYRSRVGALTFITYWCQQNYDCFQYDRLYLCMFTNIMRNIRQ